MNNPKCKHGLRACHACWLQKQKTEDWRKGYRAGCAAALNLVRDAAVELLSSRDLRPESVRLIQEAFANLDSRIEQHPLREGEVA